MIFKHLRLTAAAALAASFSMAATPAAAVELPVVSTTPVQIETGAAADQAQYRYRHGRYDRYRHGRYRHRDRVDAGDVIAGVLVLGAIAAIADAANDHDRDRYRERDERYRDYDDYDDRDDYDSSGLERAADMCVDAVERDRQRVEDVDTAQRTGEGWYVSGRLSDGASWQCWIDNNGRISDVEISGTDYSARDDYDYEAGEQWSDDAYARARASAATPADDTYTYRDQPAAARPAYPGGPVEGEEGYPVDEGY